MASIRFTKPALDEFKKALRADYPEISSSHLTEAIAASLGFNTHASLLADLRARSMNADFILLDEARFSARLQEFGYPVDPECDFEFYLRAPDIISTVTISSFDIGYRTLRERAWRNLMVSAVNAALEQGLFTLIEDDNRWHKTEHSDPGTTFDFALPNGLPVRGYVNDAGFGELTIHVAVNPIGTRVKASFAGFWAGDVFAAGWLERKTGAWLQSSTHELSCRRHLLHYLAEMDVRPHGFGDRGRVIM